jgi:hypothetical protein
MGLKNFDFKEFLLQRGEKLALVLAAVVGGLLFFSGVFKAFSAGSPGRTASDIETLRSRAKSSIDNSQPPAENDQQDAKELAAVINFDRVEPALFSQNTPFFIRSTVEDTKRRNPDILAAGDFHAEVIRAPIRSYMISGKGDELLVLVDRAGGSLGAGGPGTPGGPGMAGPGGRMGGQGGMPGGLGQRLRGGMGRGAGGGGIMGPGPGGMGMPPGMGMGMPPGMGMGGPGGMGEEGEGSPGGGTSMPGGAMVRRVPAKAEYIDIDKLDKNPNVRPAESIWPLHMVMVTASFPYKEQWEEFRRALRKRDLPELFQLYSSGEANFEFHGLEIQRRTLGPNGQVKQDWDDAFMKTWTDSMKRLFIRSVGIQEDDVKEQFLIVPGLTSPRPLMARDLKYPEVKLDTIQKTVESMEKAYKESIPKQVSLTTNRFKGDGFNPFSPRGFEQQPPSQGGYGMLGGMQGMQPGMMQPGGAGRTGGAGVGGDRGDRGEGNFLQQQQEVFLPDHVMVRFLDPTVEPGFTYQYRVKVKMANPNFKRTKDVAFPSLAKPEFLTSKDWATSKDLTVSVPADNFYYVVNETSTGGNYVHEAAPMSRDKMPVQIHRWLTVEQIDPNNPDTRSTVGEWSILDRALFSRGEYLRKTANVEVPVWFYPLETYVMPSAGRTSRGRVSVEYHTRQPTSTTSAVLVDFEGGEQVRHLVPQPAGQAAKSVFDSSPIQALILRPDGKLIVRNSGSDTEDDTRKARLEEWRKLIREAKTGQLTHSNLQQQGNQGMMPGGPGGTGGRGGDN